MNGKNTDVPNAVEGTGYEVSLDSRREVLFAKEHADGRVTQVQIERRGGDNSLSVLEIRGDEELGHQHLGAHDTLSAAVDSAAEWINANPEGVDA